MPSQFDRVELTRVLVQALAELGYTNAAQTLERDSGVVTEHPAIAAMRAAIRCGDFDSAELALEAAHEAGALQGHDGSVTDMRYVRRH